MNNKNHTRSNLKSANKSHTYGEEYTFIQSEQIDNEDNPSYLTIKMLER